MHNYTHTQRSASNATIALSVPIIPSGHGDRVGGVAWHPQATLTQEEGLVNLVSGAGDMCVNLWSLNR